MRTIFPLGQIAESGFEGIIRSYDRLAGHPASLLYITHKMQNAICTVFIRSFFSIDIEKYL